MAHKNTTLDSKFTINCKGKLLDFAEPKVMGILNITPDSFYDGGKFQNKENIISQVERMIYEGVDIIDIGAFSSQPGAKEISQKEELRRLEEALSIVRGKFQNLIISVDTYRSEVAKTLIKDFDIDIINDISAGEFDENMFEVIAEYQVPYIIMHMQGTPANMQSYPIYNNVVLDIVKYFSDKVSNLLKIGVNDIIIDPGFGFGKTIDHNYELLSKLKNFSIFDLPIMVGLSRKSLIYKLLEIMPKNAINGSSIVHTIALLNGANILRVHDVKEAKEAIKIVGMINHFE